MYVVNPDSISENKKFYCKSKNLKKFLCELKKIPYVSKYYDEEIKRMVWIFIKTKELSDALYEWKQNKINGIRAIQ